MKPVSVLWVIGVAILFPLFFQLSGNIYNSQEAIVDSGGILNKLPLPVSILACLGGILLLKDNFRRASLAYKVVGAMLLVMLISFFLAGAGLSFEKRKVILLAQVLLPVAGLVLGQMVIDDTKTIPKAFLGVLLLVVPTQLVAGWIQGHFTLTHNLYVFGVYQHFQYVPLILVCAFVVAMTALWNSHRKYFYFLMPLMAIYVVASFSLLTMFALSAFLVSFGLSKHKERGGRGGVWAITGLAFICMLSYFFIMKDSVQNDSQYLGKIQMLASGETPKNMEDRLADWRLYGNGIIESGRVALFGHPAPFPREVKSSAHNWYLDMAYNFGLISWLPTILLIGYTAYLLWHNRGSLQAETLWLAVVVFYLILIDSNFKVTLRQPYPGIFAYFLWGMLLSVLLGKRAERVNDKAI